MSTSNSYYRYVFILSNCMYCILDTSHLQRKFLKLLLNIIGIVHDIYVYLMSCLRSPQKATVGEVGWRLAMFSLKRARREKLARTVLPIPGPKVY